MFCVVFENVTLCVPADSGIARCGVVSPVDLPSIQISHGGLLDTISMPVPATAGAFAAGAAFSAFGAGAGLSALGAVGSASKPGSAIVEGGADFCTADFWTAAAGPGAAW